jgi:hypothetical protein
MPTICNSVKEGFKDIEKNPGYGFLVGFGIAGVGAYLLSVPPIGLGILGAGALLIIASIYYGVKKMASYCFQHCRTAFYNGPSGSGPSEPLVQPA